METVPPTWRCDILLLASDLDGTFLDGRQADRLTLYRLLRASPHIRLVYVTGRGLETILPLLDDPMLPDPEFIIADVGATIVHREGLKPVAPLQWEIDAQWVGLAPVLAALEDLTGLERQAVPQERRASFLTSDPDLIAEVQRRLTHLPVDVLHSARRYLDVLPRGVNKGSTLARLIDQLQVRREDVFVAGDTLNDLSLYEVGFAGVVVGSAERALSDATRAMPLVVHARSPGAGGILEALRAKPDLELPAVVHADSPSGDAQLVVVYHRLPWQEERAGGGTQRTRHTSPNGIIPTLLGCFEGGRQGSWVAWSTASAGEPGEVRHELVDESRFPNLVAAKLSLLPQDVERFYKKFSKEAFWPVIFSFVDRARFHAADWEHFVEINQCFAAAAATEADRGAQIWIHDYNLWVVPGELRRLRPDVQIGFFHHTAFPPADVFNVIPWAGQILGSLAQCDHVGFHIPRYAVNFLDALQSRIPTTVLDSVACAPRFRVHGGALAIAEMPSRIRAGERELTLGAHPVGVNLRAIAEILERPGQRERVEELSRRRVGRRVILSVERLDYVKGPLQKLQAFELLLEHHPEHSRRVELVFITTPPAPGMEVYDEVREAVDQAVGRINGRFGTLDWTPVNYLFRALPFEDVVLQCAAADVAWITPLRDGLNLVAKEFVAAQAQVDGAGVLLLSEFAGASVEMHGALLTNPYDLEGMSADLHHALALGPAERRQRIIRMNAGLARNDVEQWSREFLGALNDPGAKRG
jgi:glucosylglycerol-phosphate synthase